jgi:outer membrane immunogenic protein
MDDANWTTTQLIDPPSLTVGTVVIDASSPDRFTPAELRVGGYARYNWQIGRWLYGLEIDAAWSNARDTHVGVPGCRIVCNAGFPRPDSSFICTLWDASFRPRVGYIVMPETLIYGTAGIAVQVIEVSGTCANAFDDPLCLSSPPFAVKTQIDRQTLTGWTVGGLERKFGAWLLRDEYRYSDFGTATGVLFAGQPSADPGSDATHYAVSIRTHIATLGLAYRF